ncbi:MAG: rhomboid family intramembrane serine protease [Planctomycetota bacterium]
MIPLIVVTSVVGYIGFDLDHAQALILDGWNPVGLVGHMFLHAGIVHLLGNMLFLWVFGNAVCAKVGNGVYPLLFLGLGLSAAFMHNVMDGSTAIGASGAINGVIGFYLILYPLNNISCYFIFGLHPVEFSVSSVWMILFWLAFDVWGVVTGASGVAYWAHLGGFAAGAGLAAFLVSRGVIEMTGSERSLLEVVREHTAQD